MYIFDWDEKKNQINFEEHGIFFEDVRAVFEDIHRITVEDSVVDGELRWRTIGIAFGIIVVLVVHLEEDFGEDIYVRMISARKAVAFERAEYDQDRAYDI